ncbi:dienelactone hydrolase family protein [Sarocladium implicatum]|nr:dienelactone hydrolase family protein [Sarocladium implicatum]
MLHRRGTPTGQDIKIENNISAYLAKASSPSSAAIILAPDVFGIWQNTKLIADELASRGYTTLMPDMFNGDQLSLDTDLSSFDIMGWFAKGSDGNNPHGPEQIDATIAAGVKHLRGLGYNKIGGVGYCIGYIIRQMKDSIDVGVVAHPSFVSPEELLAIKGPLSIAAAEFDNIFPVEKRRETEDLLLGDKFSHPFQMNLFSGVHHGFACRGDLSNKQVTFAKEQAFLQTVAWYDRFLKE